MLPLFIKNHKNVQDPLATLRGGGMVAAKVLVCVFGATVLALCAWGMTRTDPGIVDGAFGVVLQVRVSLIQYLGPYSSTSS